MPSRHCANASAQRQFDDDHALGGLWHGASWNFVLWGGLNGLGLIVYKGWRASARGAVTRWWHHAVGVFLTFHFITMTRIWFRSGGHVCRILDTPHDIWTEWFTANVIEQLLFEFWSSPFGAIVSGYGPVLGLMAAGMAIHCLTGASSRLPHGIRQCAVVGAVGHHLPGHWFGIRRNVSGVQPFIYFSSELLRDLDLLIALGFLIGARSSKHRHGQHTPG